LTSLQGDLIIVAGLDTFGTAHSDMWRYTPSTSNWQQLNSIPASGRREGLCFNDTNSLYYTLGLNQAFQKLKETWKCSNPSGVKEAEEQSIKLFPNPANSYIQLELNGIVPDRNSKFILFDCIGKVVSESIIRDKTSTISLTGFTKGLYFAKFYLDGSVATLKFVKE